MITFDRVTKKFTDFVAIDNISFKVKKGEIIGFLGLNGAGKTTTMRLILGYLTPFQGKITVDNFDPSKNRLAVLKLVGYLAENNPLYLEMKVGEYLDFVARTKRKKDWREIIKKVGLEEMVGEKIETLSRGYKQRVGLAAALIGNPKILILDEPTSGLDPIEQEKIRELIIKRSKDKIVIFSSHILSEVEKIATRIIIINKGRIVYDGKKFKRISQLEKTFKKLVANKKND